MKGVTQLSTELVDMFMSVCTTEKSIVGTDSGAITSFSFFPFPLPNRKSNKSGVLFFPKKRCAMRGVVAENSWREGTDVSISCIHGRSNYCKNGRTSITIMNSYSICLLQSASTRFCNWIVIDRLRIGASYRSVVESCGWSVYFSHVIVLGKLAEYIYTNDVILRPFRIRDYPSSWFVNDQVIQGMCCTTHWRVDGSLLSYSQIHPLFLAIPFFRKCDCSK